MARRRSHRRDENHQELVAAFRALGATVLDLADVGQNAPDLLVGFRGVNHLVEIKSRKNTYGRKGLTQGQAEFTAVWQGAEVRVVYEAVDILKVFQIEA